MKLQPEEIEKIEQYMEEHGYHTISFMLESFTRLRKIIATMQESLDILDVIVDKDLPNG